MSAPTQISTRGCAARLGGCIALLILLALIPAAFWMFTSGWDAVLVAPWGYPLFGRPALAGHWVSTFTTPSGIRFALFVELERARDAGGAPLSVEERGLEQISGHANWCDDRGRHLENLDVQGSVPSYSGILGSADGVAIQIDAGKPPPVGLLPTKFQGQWHGDSLTLKPTFSFYTGSAYESSDSNIDQTRPMTIQLHQGELGEYQAACAK